MATPTYSKGLEGVIAGETALSTVGKEGKGLSYRGYSITDLAEQCIFEEVAYLLLYGDLPTKDELANYRRSLVAYRGLSPDVKRALELIPKNAHPMDILKTGVALMGTMYPEEDRDQVRDIIDRLMASYGSVLLYHYHYWNSGLRIDTRGHPDDTVAQHFVRLLHLTEPNPEYVRVVDISLILYAEHGFNASTFSCLVTTSTLSDVYSAMVSGIGTLRGPLHGGANEAAMELIERFSDEQSAVKGVKEMLSRKEKIMGFGHRVYKVQDPRHPIIKDCSLRLSKLQGGKPQLYKISCAVEKVMKDEKGMFCNLDFFAASAYHQCGIPTNFFTPIFVIARTSGWGAHIVEQRANNRLMRPKGLYTGPGSRSFVPIAQRKATLTAKL